MSHFGDYMDGVPVKISERYKRPPRIDWPYTVDDCLSRAHKFVDDVKYCTTFESNVLVKLKELRSLKETKRNEKRHRLQLLEEAKQKRFDVIAAAEAEEKLKQLSVSEVSYPSTEEISAISPGEKPIESCGVTQTPEGSPQNDAATLENDINYPSHSNKKEAQLNILQPTLVHQHQPNNLLDDPDPLQKLKMTTKISKMPQFHNIDTLTFKDFEHDTSSPFDNVELKTINDMELLAQVLQIQRDASSSSHDQQVYLPEQSYTVAPNCGTQAQLEGITYLPNMYIEQPVQGSSGVYSPPQNYPNGYYMPSDNVCDNNIPIENVNIYMNNFQYYVPAGAYPQADSYYNNSVPVNSDSSQLLNDANYISQPYYFPYQQAPVPYPSANVSLDIANNIPQEPNENQINQNSIVETRKSRSRSVPDIVRELNEELAFAKLRVNERSYNASPNARPKIMPKSTSADKKERKSRHKMEHLPNPYDKLPQGLQTMCQKIHGMGFPLDRVARVCTLIGENDKKVIEGLLILGEIMDLGFSEEKASAVLAKHGFNRDKALDELVS